MNIENKKFREVSDLKSRYNVIYEETFNTSYTGVHSTILKFAKPSLKKDITNVLDVGCGAGRLSIILSGFVKNVDAFDYAKKAIETAKTFSEYANSKNINFFVSDENEFETDKKYDVITISEVIEHVDDPEHTIHKFSQYLKDDGVMIISCPNFNNFKGGIYMTLHNLFDLPMSLTDRRQVFLKDMEKWAASSGLKVSKTIGNSYDWGWGGLFYKDMKRRIPLNMGDNNPRLVEFSNFDKMNEWMSESVSRNEEFLNFLQMRGFLKKRAKEYTLNLPSEISEKERLYLMDGDFKENLYFSDKFPVNTMGGDSIYFLKKSFT